MCYSFIKILNHKSDTQDTTYNSNIENKLTQLWDTHVIEDYTTTEMIFSDNTIFKPKLT